MKKTILIILPLIAVVTLLFFKKTPTKIQEIMSPSSSPTPTIFSNFTAKFEIYTNGTKRIFTASMYHNLSEDVFITSSNPSVIQIKKPGITWANFFQTLPFELTKDCLTTGTGQKFCTNQKQSLKFYLNEVENKNALDQEIMPSGFLKVVYE